jgi:hypothetical protein
LAVHFNSAVFVIVMFWFRLVFYSYILPNPFHMRYCSKCGMRLGHMVSLVHISEKEQTAEKLASVPLHAIQIT